MKYRPLVQLVLPVLLALLTLASCKESEEAGEYDNWSSRNEAFIDSIARVAAANSDGQWIAIRSYKLVDHTVDGSKPSWSNADYVYCHVEVSGKGIATPLYTDTVQVNYRGRLIPSASYPEGRVFDQSFKGELDPQINVPSRFSVGSVIDGWTSALQCMHVGDTWRVYIPAPLAYGQANKTNIPAGSTLIFDINLVAIYPIGTPVP